MKIPEQIYVKSVLCFLNCMVTLHVFPWVFSPCPDPMNKSPNNPAPSEVLQPMFHAMMSVLAKGSGKAGGLRSFAPELRVWVGGLPPNNVSKELNMKLKEHRGHILAHLGVNELVKFGYVWIIWMCFLWLDSLAFFASDVSGIGDQIGARPGWSMKLEVRIDGP
jgi:hypothetical protein